MVNTSKYPIAVVKDGVEYRLDTLAYNVSTRSGFITGLSDQVGSAVEVAGRSGSLYLKGRHREEKTCVLVMWVNDSDMDGLYPSYTRFRENLDLLNTLFDTTNGQIELREYVGGIPTEGVAGIRKALVEVRSSIQPDYEDDFQYAPLKVECIINSGVWSSGETVAYTSPMGTSMIGTTLELTGLQGGTAEIEDAFIVVDGPINSPTITDMNNGSVIQLQTNIAAGQQWVVDCGKYLTLRGTNIDQSPSAGVSMARYTFNSGPLAPSMFPIHPRGQLRLTGSGASNTTRLRVTANRKYH